MEKPISNIVLDLLEQYRFDQLSVDQIKLVLSELSEDEYIAYQVMIQETNGLTETETLKAPQSIHSQLKRDLSSQFEQPNNGLSKVLNFGIPLWMACLAALGFYLLLSYSDLFKVDTTHESKEVMIETVQADPIYIYKTDTIFQEIKSEPIIITKEIIKTIEVEVPVAAKQEPGYVAGSQKELGLIVQNGALDLYADEASLEKAQKPIGQTVAEDGALMDLLDGLK